jgi:hypothetical protein
MWWLFLVACGSCGPGADDTSDPCDPGPEPTLELGTGEFEHVPLDPDGAVVELIHGPQGGYHVVVSLGATGLDASEPWEVDLLGTIDGVVRGQTEPFAEPRCNPDAGQLQVWGLYLVWDAEPEELDGRSAHVTAVVTDAAGTRLTDEGDLTIEDPSL